METLGQKKINPLVCENDVKVYVQFEMFWKSVELE